MNTNPNAKRVLVYGASQVWGDMPPGKLNRFPANVRWTGVLQDKLGNDYEVIEEGLCGRTTNLDDPFPGYEDKNGKDYLFPCLNSQNPLDYVVLLTGSNDLKKVFNRTAKDVARAVEELIILIEKYAGRDGEKAKVLLLAPPRITEKIVALKPHFAGAPEKSLEMGREFEKVASKHKIGFIDLAKIVEPSEEDGLHFDPEAHARVAEVVYEYLLENMI